MSLEFKENICYDLNILYIIIIDVNEMYLRMNLIKLMFEKKIVGDGNCFFRVILFSFINFEEFYGIICNVVCVYMMENEEFFNLFLNDGV